MADSPKFSLKQNQPTEPKERPVNVQKTPSVMTHFGIGTYKGADGWYVFEVRLNPETKQVGEVTLTKSGIERETAIELFRKMAVTLNIVG